MTEQFYIVAPLFACAYIQYQEALHASYGKSITCSIVHDCVISWLVVENVELRC